MLKITEISESCFRIYPVVDGRDEHFIATFISRELAEEYIGMKIIKDYDNGIKKIKEKYKL